jgi:hypothetical protein
VGAHVIENGVSQISSGHGLSLPPPLLRRNGKGAKIKRCASLRAGLGLYHVNSAMTHFI